MLALLALRIVIARLALGASMASSMFSSMVAFSIPIFEGSCWDRRPGGGPGPAPAPVRPDRTHGTHGAGPIGPPLGEIRDIGIPS